MNRSKRFAEQAGCDGAHHPGWPDKDGPGTGWIFRFELT
jgi:hypothetical protein